MNTLSNQEFMELLEKYRDEFYRFACKTVWNSSEVDDVFSEAVMVAWQKRENFTPGTNFRAWFYRILLNKSYVANRHTKRYGVDYEEATDAKELQLGEEEEPKAFTEPEYFLERVSDELLEALDVLREQERACLLLRATENSSYKEIAHILDIPVGTVMTHLARGRTRIRKHLSEKGDGEIAARASLALA